MDIEDAMIVPPVEKPAKRTYRKLATMPDNAKEIEEELPIDLETFEGRKQILKTVIKRFGDKKATSSDAIKALERLMELEGDIERIRSEAVKVDPYSVMKVFLRAEGLSNVENLKKNLGNDGIAKGLAKIFDCKRIRMEWKDGSYGEHAKSAEEEKAEKKRLAEQRAPKVQATELKGGIDVAHSYEDQT